MTDPHTPDADGAASDLRDLLSRAVPPAPATHEWPAKVQGWRRRQRTLAGLVALVLLLVVPAGVVLLTRQAAPIQQVASELFAGPGTEVYGDAMILSRGGEPTVLCFGPIHDIYPPDCTGPTLLGEFSWDEVPFEEEGEVRWSTENVRVQGFFDPADGTRGSFMLVGGLNDAAASEHDDAPSRQDPLFPQLCEDPLRGADPALTGDDAEAALHAALEGLEVVNVWVSNGRDAYNVLVRGDAEEVHAALREVWGGELCVAESGDATEQERIEVVERIFAALPRGQVLAGGPTGTTGGIDLDLLYLDEASAQVIREEAGAIPVQVRTELTPVGAEPVIVLD